MLSHSTAHHSPLYSRWLKVQYLLKDFHENLQLALEVSSFYQQADNIMCAINNMVIQLAIFFILQILKAYYMPGNDLITNDF